jgi:hypothetical protein
MYNLADMEGSKQKISGKITEEVLAKYPEMPTLTLARKLLSDYPEVYTSINAARSAVRYYRGTIGNASRGKRGIAERPEPASTRKRYGYPEPVSSS